MPKCRSDVEKEVNHVDNDRLRPQPYTEEQERSYFSCGIDALKNVKE